MTFEELKNIALQEASRVDSGKVFILRDLFQGTVWSDIEKGDKLSLGRWFKKYTKGNCDCGWVFLEKRSDNAAQYQRLGTGTVAN